MREKAQSIRRIGSVWPGAARLRLLLPRFVRGLSSLHGWQCWPGRSPVWRRGRILPAARALLLL